MCWLSFVGSSTQASCYCGETRVNILISFRKMPNQCHFQCTIYQFRFIALPTNELYVIYPDTIISLTSISRFFNRSISFIETFPEQNISKNELWISKINNCNNKKFNIQRFLWATSTYIIIIVYWLISSSWTFKNYDGDFFCSLVVWRPILLNSERTKFSCISILVKLAKEYKKKTQHNCEISVD